ARHRLPPRRAAGAPGHVLGSAPRPADTSAEHQPVVLGAHAPVGDGVDLALEGLDMGCGHWPEHAVVSDAELTLDLLGRVADRALPFQRVQHRPGGGAAHTILL